MSKRILLTGGCGFLGHHIVEHILNNTDWSLVVIDRLSYAAQGFDRLREIGAHNHNRVRVFTHDLSQPLSSGLLREIGSGPYDYIVHAAAETHVDNSITDALPFVMSNVVGTHTMLELARKLEPKLFVYCSTDEVYGPAFGDYRYRESDSINPTNPYAATKAGAEALCNAYANTHGVPVLVTNTMNLFGERQHFEKFIPMVVGKVLRGETVTIHADETRTVPGSRFYLHARNYAAALLYLVTKGARMMTWDLPPRINIVGEREVSNLAMAQLIAGIVGKPLDFKLVDFHSSRPGHDLRYALDGTLLESLGYRHPIGFDASLVKTVRWTLAHRDRWLP